MIVPRSAATDHPHGRGENRTLFGALSVVRGPSPRAWGKLVTFFFLFPKSRTIPTGVGKTVQRRRAVSADPDHPHGRGENGFSPPSRGTLRGPSPRAWGKLNSGNTSGSRCRTIPTGVGKTPTSWSDFVLHILYLVDIQLSNNFGSQLHAFSR